MLANALYSSKHRIPSFFHEIIGQFLIQGNHIANADFLLFELVSDIEDLPEDQGRARERVQDYMLSMLYSLGDGLGDSVSSKWLPMKLLRRRLRN